jgi:2-oxoglutarate ferredoxin oxidoreductase subunit beta
MKAALTHKGLSVIDVISPCTTFNDHEGSTKSYAYMKDHEEPLHTVDFVPFFEDIQVEIAEGATREVTLHDGSRLLIHKLDRDYDPTDRLRSIQVLHESTQREEVLTGILYVDVARETFSESLNLGGQSLATLDESKVRPPRAVLDQIVEEFR